MTRALAHETACNPQFCGLDFVIYYALLGLRYVRKKKPNTEVTGGAPCSTATAAIWPSKSGGQASANYKRKHPFKQARTCGHM